MTEKELALIKEAQRAYKRSWRAKNKDKIKAANARYWLKKAQQTQEQQTEERLYAGTTCKEAEN